MISAAAIPGPDRHDDHVPAAACRAHPLFGQAAGTHVVAERHRHAEASASAVAKGKSRQPRLAE